MGSGLSRWVAGSLWMGAGACLAFGTACDMGPSDLGPLGGDGGSGGSEVGDPSPGNLGYQPVKPNVMLLIDRSGSMAEPADCGTSSCPSKWNQLLTLEAYLAEGKQVARLGLAVFPSAEYNGCSVSSGLLVPLSDAPDVDQQIMAAIQGITPGGQTPIAAALDEIGLVGGLDDRERDNIVLVMTDGKPNCACIDDDACEKDHAVSAVERLANSDPPVDIDIIGFGTSAQQAHETLSAMATAAGDDKYYQSDTIEELIATLYEIGTASAPCKFYLDETPEPAKLIVWLDGTQVPLCPAEPCDSGYTYDLAEGLVELHGATCDLVRDGQPHQVWFDEAE